MSTSEADDVVLLMDGREYGGWLSTDISAGVERVARDFSFGVTWRWPGSSDQAYRVAAGTRAQVMIGSDLVMTGYVYATPVAYDARFVSVGLAGRSLTSDLVDCSAARGQWRGQTVASIVSALVAPYGLEVVDQSGDALRVVDHQVEPGETVFESIDRLLSVSALLLTDDERGRVVIATAGAGGRATDALELGVNVLKGSAPLDFSGVYSSYQCIGQRAGTDEVYGLDASEVAADVSDTRVSRYRNLTIQPQGQVTPEIAVRRVEWERASRIAKALATDYEVLGWRQSDGRLWRSNQLVPVRDRMIGLDREMLIVEVAYRIDERGRIAVLRVAPPDAVSPKPKAFRTGKKSGGDAFEYLLPADWEGST